MENLQVIADAALSNYVADIGKLTTGSAVRCEGVLRESPGGKQKVELRATVVHV